MALIKCTECKNDISDKADKCPKCGAPLKKKASGCSTLFAIVAGVFLVGYIASLVSAPSSPNTAQVAPRTESVATSIDETSAWVAAEGFVKRTLKAPSTASFGSILSDYQRPKDLVTREADGTYIVRIWVDAQNSFGAQMRTHFVVKMRYNAGRAAWTLIDITSAEQ